MGGSLSIKPGLETVVNTTSLVTLLVFPLFVLIYDVDDVVDRGLECSCKE